MKMPKKCNFKPFGLLFPSPKLHQDAKKNAKKCNFWPKPKMQKKNAQFTFSGKVRLLVISDCNYGKSVESSA
jgi:hypothetical protein